MLVVGAMLLRSAVSGQRCWMHGPDSASPHRGKRYGPFVLQQLAACLAMGADCYEHKDRCCDGLRCDDEGISGWLCV